MDLHWEADVAPGSPLLHEMWACLAEAVSKGSSGSCSDALMEQCSSISWGARTTQQEQTCEARNNCRVVGKSCKCRWHTMVKLCSGNHCLQVQKFADMLHTACGTSRESNMHGNHKQAAWRRQVLQVCTHKNLLVSHHQHKHQHRHHLTHPLGRTCRPWGYQEAGTVFCHLRHCQVNADWPFRHSEACLQQDSNHHHIISLDATCSLQTISQTFVGGEEQTQKMLGYLTEPITEINEGLLYGSPCHYSTIQANLQ